MYARLWWKDLRQFWPIWIFLVLAAVVVQMFVLVISGPNANQDWFQLLSAMAMGWTCLYALAVGAAAFAGEREAGTLKLLDIIPISRSMVWSGKVSFGIATTLAMAIVLLIVAMLGAAGTPLPSGESGQSSDSFTRVLRSAWSCSKRWDGDCSLRPFSAMRLRRPWPPFAAQAWPGRSRREVLMTSLCPVLTSPVDNSFSSISS